MSKYILEMKGINKEFPGVKVLNNVNLAVQEGEIHALIGENGAGKSTLMNILSGVYPHGTYTGDIYFNGQLCTFKDIKHSEQMGIVIIHQELALVPCLSIADNIYLGNETVKNGMIDKIRTSLETKKMLAKVGLGESPDTLISEIGVGKQQLVEIAKALSKEVKLLILDEPTAALNEDDSENLLQLMLEFKRQGITSILISHKLNEILKVADSITVLRDGRTIETMDTHKDKIDEDRIIKGMVGRELTDRYPKRDVKITDVIFEARGWSVFHPMITDRKVIDDVNIHVKKGEVVGIAGLMGAGRTEFAMSIFGRSYGKKISGHLYKDGKEIHIKDVAQAIAHGIAYVTEDRKNYGLVLINDIRTNITMSNLSSISKNNVVNNHQEIKEAREFVRKMNIKCSSLQQATGNLSGGNQQKVVLSKWIFTQPDVLILDEPTRGIDVGAKYEIYGIINELAADGKGVIIISSEMPELLGMCDRIYVMSEGKITGELSKEEASQEKIMKCVISHKKGEVS